MHCSPRCGKGEQIVAVLFSVKRASLSFWVKEQGWPAAATLPTMFGPPVTCSRWLSDAASNDSSSSTKPKDDVRCAQHENRRGACHYKQLLSAIPVHARVCNKTSFVWGSALCFEFVGFRKRLCSFSKIMNLELKIEYWMDDCCALFGTRWVKSSTKAYVTTCCHNMHC